MSTERLPRKFRKGPYGSLARGAVALGWTVEVTKGDHLRWTPPGGGDFVITCATPSDRRAVLNDRAILRRHGLPRSIK